MGKCCGYTRNTPYCPICGKIMEPDPLIALLKHLSKTANSFEYDAVNMEKISMAEIEDGCTSADRNDMIRNAKRLALKWRTWHNALDELMKKGGTVT